MIPPSTKINKDRVNLIMFLALRDPIEFDLEESWPFKMDWLYWNLMGNHYSAIGIGSQLWRVGRLSAVTRSCRRGFGPGLGSLLDILLHQARAYLEIWIYHRRRFTSWSN